MAAVWFPGEDWSHGKVDVFGEPMLELHTLGELGCRQPIFSPVQLPFDAYCDVTPAGVLRSYDKVRAAVVGSLRLDLVRDTEHPQ
jgi:hypothetical protein